MIDYSTFIYFLGLHAFPRDQSEDFMVTFSLKNNFLCQ